MNGTMAPRPCDEHEPIESLFDNAIEVFNHALKKLLRTPASDLPALALKIDRHRPPLNHPLEQHLLRLRDRLGGV